MTDKIVEHLSKNATILLNSMQEWRAKGEEITAFEGKASYALSLLCFC